MYDIIGDLTAQCSQNWFTRSLSGGYKMTNGCILFKNGRRSSQRKRSLWPSHIQGSVEVCLWTGIFNVETRSQWAGRGWRMALANESMRSSAIFNVFIFLFTFLAHFWFVICKSDPHWLFAKWSLFAFVLTCPLVEYFTSPTPNFRVVRFLSGF